LSTTDSPSPYGLYDMAGNVSQWLNKSPNHVNAITRGGNWDSNEQELLSTNTIAQNAEFTSDKNGFRCIKPIPLNRDINLEEMLRKHKKIRSRKYVKPSERIKGTRY